MTSRDMGSSWCTHGVHMYSGDYRYDVRAHVGSMVALKKTYVDE